MGTRGGAAGEGAVVCLVISPENGPPPAGAEFVGRAAAALLLLRGRRGVAQQLARSFFCVRRLWTQRKAKSTALPVGRLCVAPAVRPCRLFSCA